MAKHTTVTYTCDLCSKDVGDKGLQRIALAYGACCELCADCAKAHEPLIAKLAELVRAVAPLDAYKQTEQWRRPYMPGGIGRGT